ncbi:hypothetical protein MAR_016072 [Mya arenaria]|uniref:Uncharacterized protein n=1 Tax=Mya arenaria TaxID=6604 RepID=A0ABY7FIT3_MYAAR|nr:uncharacterized protein LOC128212220 [Mya arenaria]WAR22098.1 hypothetical protein MAR_016072 [Mya arenaria]
MKVLILVLLFCSPAAPERVHQFSTRTKRGVFNVPSLIIKACDLALNVVEFFSDSGSSEHEELLEKIVDKIDKSNEALKWHIVQVLQLNKVEDTRLEIHSALIDLKNWITAETEQSSEEPETGILQASYSKDAYKGIFQRRTFDAIPRIRYLARHFVDNIPGTSKSLIELILEPKRCNLTALFEIQEDVLKLISSGIFLEMTLMSLEGETTLRNEKLYWEHEVSDVLDEFKAREKECRSKRRFLALDDLKQTRDIAKLHKSNSECFLWAWNDILMFDEDIPDGLLSYSVDPATSLYTDDTDDLRKMVIYGEHENYTTADNVGGIIWNAIYDHSLNESTKAKDISDVIKRELIENKVVYKAVVVYFTDNLSRYHPKVHIDNRSPAITVLLQRVNFRICTSPLCEVNWDNWLALRKTFSGHFTIYVIPGLKKRSDPRNLDKKQIILDSSKKNDNSVYNSYISSSACGNFILNLQLLIMSFHFCVILNNS